MNELEPIKRAFVKTELNNIFKCEYLSANISPESDFQESGVFQLIQDHSQRSAPTVESVKTAVILEA